MGSFEARGARQALRARVGRIQPGASLAWAAWLLLVFLALVLAGPVAAASDDEGESHDREEVHEDDDQDELDAEHEDEAGSSDDGPSIGVKSFDVVVIRPLTAAQTLAGFPFYIASAPFLGPTDGVSDAWDLFVAGPWDYTFERDLGDL